MRKVVKICVCFSESPNFNLDYYWFWPDSFGFELSLLKLDLNIRPMAHPYSTKTVKKRYKKNEKDFCSEFFYFFCEKTTLNRVISRFSAFCKPH